MLAQDQLEAAIAEMRARFTAISRQIADQLDALARTAARSPQATHTAILNAAADIGAMQERLCAEANRLPIGPEQRYALMQTLLHTQHDSLLHLGVLVREQALAARGLIGPAPKTGTRASPNAYMPTSAHDGMTEVQSYGDIGRALASIGAPSQPIRSTQPAHSIHGGLPEIASTAWPSYGVGASSPMEPAARYSRRPVSPHRRGKGASAQPRRRAFALVKGAISRSLGLTATAGVGLLIAYATFPQATPSDSEVKRLELPSSSIGPATPLPAPRNYTSASRTQPPLPTPDAPSGPKAVPDRAVPEPSAMPPPSYASAPSGPRAIPDRAVPEPSAIPSAPHAPAPGGLGGAPVVPTPGPSASPVPAPQIALDTPLPGSFLAAPVGATTIAAVNPSAPAPSAAIPHAQTAPAPTRVPNPPTENAVPERFVPVLFTHKDQTTAARTFADLQREYPSVLKRRHSEVQSVDVNSNGTWHRLVVLPAGSRQQATHVCEQLMSAGYDRCWVKVY